MVTQVCGRIDKKNDHGAVLSTTQYRSQKRDDDINCTRLDEHSDNGPAQSAHSSSPHGSLNVPGVQDEPDDNHQGEEDVE